MAKYFGLWTRTKKLVFCVAKMGSWKTPEDESSNLSGAIRLRSDVPHTCPVFDRAVIFMSHCKWDDICVVNSRKGSSDLSGAINIRSNPPRNRTSKFGKNKKTERGFNKF